jgi:universal stress protein A
MAIKRIIVPTDFSDQSVAALDYAVGLVRSFPGAEIIIIHVVEPIRHTRLIPDVSLLLEQRREEAAHKIAALEKRARRRYSRCRSEVHFGIPYEIIGEVAEKLKADLIIIATHGHSGLAHLFLGSVAERVVRLAECPVLTVRASNAQPLPLRKRRSGHKRKAVKTV